MNNKFGILLITGLLSFFLNSCTKYNLVASYHFNGDALDNSNNFNNGKINGAKFTNNRFGDPEHALFFDGENDNVDFGNNRNLTISGDLSISLWVYPNSLSTRNGIINCQYDNRDDMPNSNNLYGLYLKNGKLEYLHESNRGENHNHIFNYSAIPVNKWSHIAIIRDVANKSVDLYLNSKFIETIKYSANPDNGDLSITRIGEFNGTVYTPRFFHGIIDDVRIYNGAIDIKKVSSLYRE